MRVADLLRICSLVRPALATADYIPALTHIQFRDGDVTTYNDVNAIQVRADVGFNSCVPGELLIKALSSFKGENVVFSLGEKLQVASGRSKINMPVLIAGKFPFDAPNQCDAEVTLTPDIIGAIKECLVAVGTDPKMPARMGVTLEASTGGKATLYSTDGVTICRASTDSPMRLPGDAPIILPTFFCEQVVALRKAYPDKPVTLELHPGALLAAFGDEALAYSKTMIDVEPIDFEAVLNRFLPANLKSQAVPDGMDSAVSRAILVQSGNDNMRTTFRKEGGNLTMSSSGFSEAVDELECKAEFDDFTVDPSLLARGLKGCSHIAFAKLVTVLTHQDHSFIYVLAHHAKEKT